MIADARIVTFTTDFGTRDPFVGLMKAQVLARCREARLVDLTHEVPAFHPEAAGFWMERVHRWCPPGTVHVAVVDPGVGTSRRLLAVDAHGQRFLAPDNGLLHAVLASPGAQAFEIGADAGARFGLGRRSATFHGRDVLAPLAGEIAAGRATSADLGPRIHDWRDGTERAAAGAAAHTPGARPMHGGVVWIDRYGNAFTSLPEEALAALGTPVVRVAGQVLPVVRTYGDAPAGALVALANSFGVVEVARVEGSAAEALGLEIGSPVELAEGSP
jgi:S-adenosylmethionine hydrolase